MDHGTRLRGVPEFKCVLCATADLKTAAWLILHETYEPPPDEGGGPHAFDPVEPRPDGGDLTPAPAVASHEEFETSISTARVAKLSAAHRAHAAEMLYPLLTQIERFGSDAKRETMVAELAATSDEASRAAIRRAGISVAHGLARARESGQLDHNLLADGVGLGAWAIGEAVGAEMSVDRILLIPDAEVQFLLRVTSRYLVREVA